MEHDDFNAEEIENFESPRGLFKEETIQLIEFKGNNFEVNREALNMIRSIEDEVIVVSVVGKARTGKSYLLNLLLDNHNKGFEVGSSVNYCTKGVWIWGSPKEKIGGRAKILFIDSEGISALNNSKTYDAKIFTLIVLISSLFIYNTTSNIDENGISELALAAQLSNSITTSNKVDKDAFITESAPKFIWAVRDFTLAKIDPDSGKEISSKEYLDLCLRSKIGKSSSDSNLIRDSLIKYFHDRDCCTLVRPVDNEDDLARLNQIPFDDLKDEFKQEITLLRNKIYTELNSKKIKGKKLNGFSLAILIEEWVNAINQGAVPNINSTWDILINKDITDFYEKALANYSENSKKLSGVMEQEELIKLLYQNKLDAMMIYNKIFNFNQDTFNNSQYLAWFNEHKRKLEAEISKFESKIVDQNYKESSNKCNEILQKGFETINSKMNENYYNSKNCDEFLKSHETFLNFYLNNAKGPQKVKKLVEFLSETKPEFLKNFIKQLEKENSSKLDEMINNFNTSEKRKIEAEIKNKQLNETTQANNEKINDLNSELEKKKREIIDLSERVRLVELDIKNRRENMQQINKKAPF